MHLSLGSILISLVPSEADPGLLQTSRMNGFTSMVNN